MYHGLSRTIEYKVLVHIRSRCENPKDVVFTHYGGRGIKVCERWKGEKGIVNFVKDMGLRPSAKHSIDRIDNDGDYGPRNCRWATRSEQARNKRNNVWLTIDGVSRLISDWSAISGVGYGTIFARYLVGWNHREAVFRKPRWGNRCHLKEPKSMGGEDEWTRKRLSTPSKPKAKKKGKAD